jgi:AcrR family transcriptional regulator
VTPRRLKPGQRREQLLDTAAALFAEKPYEDVFVEEIAARAGVSRATLYHYYPSKRDLYVAIFKRASGRFLARVDPDPQLSLAEQLAAGLEAHIQSFVDHPIEAVAINRGALSDDPAIQAILAEELNIVRQRLIDVLVAEGCLRDATEIAVEGWLAFVRAACVKWIQSQNISRGDLTEMCVRAFDCALGAPASRLGSRGREYATSGEHFADLATEGAAFSGSASTDSRVGVAFSRSRSLSRLASSAVTPRNWLRQR